MMLVVIGRLGREVQSTFMLTNSIHYTMFFTLKVHIKSV